MTEKIIIEDYKNTIHRLQNECTEKTDLILKTRAQYEAVLEQNKSLQSELLLTRSEVSQKTDYIREQLEIIKQLKDKNRELRIKTARLSNELTIDIKKECEKLKKSVMKQCPICGETFLSPIGMELYDKNTRYKQALDEIKDICCAKTKDCHIGCFICSTKCNENKILAIINKADFGKSETRLGESFVEKVEPPIIQEAKEVNNGDC